MIQKKVINYLNSLDEKTGEIHHVSVFGDESGYLSSLLDGREGDKVIFEFISLDKLEEYINKKLVE